MATTTRDFAEVTDMYFVVGLIKNNAASPIIDFYYLYHRNKGIVQCCHSSYVLDLLSYSHNLIIGLNLRPNSRFIDLNKYLDLNLPAYDLGHNILRHENHVTFQVLHKDKGEYVVLTHIVGEFESNVPNMVTVKLPQDELIHFLNRRGLNTILTNGYVKKDSTIVLRADTFISAQ